MSRPQTLWRIRLFGGPSLEFGEGEILTRFRSKKVGALLAYLALKLDQSCPREQIACDLWPDENDERVLSNRLRFTLASLRTQLEPSGFPFGSVLDVSSPGRIRLRAQGVWCDVAELEEALSGGRRSEAAKLLSGPLMPGYFDEWLSLEQIRFDLLREELAAEPVIIQEAPPKRQPVAPQESRLPLYLTDFFGREAELGRLETLIADSRLVTLAGSGGIGKTRLAVEAARRFAETSVFVPLAEIDDPTRIPEAALAALGISSRRDAPTIELVGEVLAERASMLVILDNAEHLVDYVADFAIAVLEAAPALRLLVTSRQRLELPGETVLVLPPLGAPNPFEDVDRLTAHPAVALFVNRARGVRPDFRLPPKTVADIATICEKLDGVPLALELAAARVATQSPHQIAEAVSASLLELKSRQRGISDRHRSLRAAIQSSFELFDSELKDFFCKLSVFDGGWNSAAAEFVTGSANAEFLLEELVVRSIVLPQNSERSESQRYSFLESLRQFAAGRLAPGEHEACADRHAQFYLNLAAAADESDVRGFSPLDSEEENLIRAFARSSEAEPISASLWPALAGALEFAFVRGRHQLALRWIDQFSPRFASIEDLKTRTHVRNAACQILPDVGRMKETVQMAAAMEADAIAGGYEAGEIFAEVVQGYVATFVGKPVESLRKHVHALERARKIDNPRLLETCLAHASGTLHDIAVLPQTSSLECQSMLEESEALARELREIVPTYSRRRALAALLLGTGLKFQGKNDEALNFYREAEQYSIALGTTTERMFAYVFCSEISLEHGDATRAAILFGAFQGLQGKMGYSIERAQHIRPTWISNLDAALRRELGSEALDEILQRGRATSQEYLIVPPARNH